jgi:hypothetical protein
MCRRSRAIVQAVDVRVERRKNPGFTVGALLLATLLLLSSTFSNLPGRGAAPASTEIRPMNWIRIAFANDLQDDEMMAVAVGSDCIALYRTKGNSFCAPDIVDLRTHALRCERDDISVSPSSRSNEQRNRHSA